MAIDLRLPGSRCLYVSYSPAEPSIYLMTRRLRDLEQLTANPSSFGLSLRKHLSGGEMISVEKHDDDRVITVRVRAEDELGRAAEYAIAAQLTGKSSNVFLLDEHSVILDRARETRGEGQEIGDTYTPPGREQGRDGDVARPLDILIAQNADHPSEAADAYFGERVAEREFQRLAAAARSKVTGELAKREKLIARLNADLAGHGDAGRWKKYGDLLLANAANALRKTDRFIVTDYFDGATPVIEIEAAENLSLTEAADKYYRRYTKARNAAAEVSRRLETASGEAGRFREQLADIERAISKGDQPALQGFLSSTRPARTKSWSGARKKIRESSAAARRFSSSDGFEILVGKKAGDNDVLTFKIARSLDTWMHAADYPGSHVVIRNPDRKQIPQRTLLEAAQLAAFYSQGKSQTKAAVHYTQKKFVNKPKGAAPGLVSLSSFKTLLVVPEFPESVELKEN